MSRSTEVTMGNPEQFFEALGRVSHAHIEGKPFAPDLRFLGTPDGALGLTLKIEISFSCPTATVLVEEIGRSATSFEVPIPELDARIRPFFSSTPPHVGGPLSSPASTTHHKPSQLNLFGFLCSLSTLLPSTSM